MISDEVVSFAKSTATKAGELIVDARNSGALSREFKAGSELVTQADFQADKLITGLINEQFPGHKILSEELSPDAVDASSESNLWIIDPIDGTVNYAHGHNQSAVSIAYVNEGQIVVGVVFNPFTDEMFWAVKGQGAWLNEKQIFVSAETDPRRAIIATGFPYTKDNLDPLFERVEIILRQCADIRRLGSAALDICWVAAGRLDGFYESLSLWDFAAAQLIAREAGATYGHFMDLPDGVDSQFHCENILVANSTLFPKLRTLLYPTTG